MPSASGLITHLCPRSIIQGYLAITAALILSFLILAIVSASGSAALFSRDNNLDFELKKSSYFLARACLEYALIKLADSPSYAGNETRDIDSDQCEVVSVETSGSNKIIKARSQVSGATTNLRLTVVTQNLSTVSLEEVIAF